MIARFASGRAGWMISILLSALLTTMNAETPAGATGIEGSISVSPIHPGPTRKGETDSGPLANVAFEIVKADNVVATFTTDAKGRFQVSVPPGSYTVRMRERKKIGGCGERTVEVTASGFAKLDWNCDTGMR
jgi:hypothetical protein